MCLSEVNLEVIPIEVSLGANIKWTLQLTFVVEDFVHLPVFLEQRGKGVLVIAMAIKTCLVGKGFGATITMVRFQCEHSSEKE